MTWSEPTAHRWLLGALILLASCSEPHAGGGDAARHDLCTASGERARAQAVIDLLDDDRPWLAGPHSQQCVKEKMDQLDQTIEKYCEPHERFSAGTRKVLRDSSLVLLKASVVEIWSGCFREAVSAAMSLSHDAPVDEQRAVLSPIHELLCTDRPRFVESQLAAWGDDPKLSEERRDCLRQRVSLLEDGLRRSCAKEWISTTQVTTPVVEWLNSCGVGAQATPSLETFWASLAR